MSAGSHHFPQLWVQKEPNPTSFHRHVRPYMTAGMFAQLKLNVDAALQAKRLHVVLPSFLAFMKEALAQTLFSCILNSCLKVPPPCRVAHLRLPTGSLRHNGG